MKISTFLLFCCLVNIFATPTYSQLTKISLNLKDATIEEVLNKIENVSEFYFLYNNKLIDITRKVNIEADQEPIKDILNDIFSKDTKFIVYDRQIILTPSDLKSLSAAMQQLKITGIVADKDGTPLAGVNVVINGTTIGVITDIDGKYSINISEGAKSLKFSFIGMDPQEITIGTQTQINVTMSESAFGLDEVVVIGYGTQKKANLTGSVIVVKMPEVAEQSAATNNVIKSLDGRIPGFSTSYNGNPTNSTAILIRGRGSLSSSTSPLVIIDGIPTNLGLNELAPNDIESMQILKDASAATIYGSRAANGVIIITTKTASEGTHIELSSSVTVGVTSPSTVPLLNAEQYGKAQWMASRNDGLNPNYGSYSFQDHQDANGIWVLDKVILPEYLDADKTMKPGNTNWEKETSRTSITKNNYVAISNGNKYGNVLFSFDDLESQGILKYNDWSRKTIRLNSDFKLFNGRLKIGENFSVILKRLQGGYANLYGNFNNVQSIVPVHTVDGIGWGGPVGSMSNRNNPLMVLELTRQNHIDEVRLVGSAFADLEIIKNLHFKSTFGIDKNGGWNRNTHPTYKDGYMQETIQKMDNTSYYGGSWTFNNILNYSFSLVDNNFQLMVGQEATSAMYKNLWGARDGFANETPNYMYLDVGETNVRNGGLGWENSQNSFFGRLNYDYKSRYLFTAIIRRDGSSRFGINNRYATFPSMSGGWVLSNETFMNSFSWLSNLKLRYGWGKTGNQEIDNYASFGEYMAYHSGRDWPYNNDTAYDIYGADQGSIPSGFRRLQIANPDLKWETTTQNNFGFDFSVLDSKLSGTFDYYLKNTTDILVAPPTMSVTGDGASSWINGATMKNWGWESTLSYTDKIGMVGYEISANAYHNTNEFTYIIPSAVGAYPGNGRDQTILGRPLNSFYGYVSEGIFQNQTEVDAAAIQPGKGIGRLKFKDVNSDGKIDADDRTWIGVNEPKFAWGLYGRLTWKDFDFSMFWNSEIGRTVDNLGTKSFTDFFGFFAGENYGTRVLDSWSPQNTSSTIPAITGSDLNNEHRFSSYFVENTSFVKLQSMSIGYNLSTSIAQKLRIKKARIFLEADNLKTLKLSGNTFTGYDSKSPNMLYPLPHSFTLGINLKF